MTHLDYIPGDLVMTNGVPLGTAKDVVYRVTSSDQSKTLKFDDGTVLKGVVRLENLEGAEFGDKGYLLGDCCAWVKDIVPIPLTSEILEKNGCKKPDGFDSYWLGKIGLLQDGDVWHLALGSIEIAVTLGNIQYVHQLQHLLFGLELNSEMEV